MYPLHALILGIIEGISEFLPISSTGHLILASKLLNLPETEFLKSFEIIIQLGAILAVVVLYGKSLITSKEVLLKVLAAFIPTAVIGFVLHHFLKSYLLGNVQVVLWALGIGGAFLILFEHFHTEKPDATENAADISYKQAIIIGLFQSIAIIPGVSRSASTIVGGLLLGLKRKTIVDFSFLLAIPTMGAATALDLFKSAHAFSSGDFHLLAIGFVTSFVVALFAIRWLLKFIKNHSFTGFGAYRIVIAVLFWIFLMR